MHQPASLLTSRAPGATGTRRSLARILAALPLVGSSGLLLNGADARRKRRRRKVQADKKQKKKTTLCLSGQTIQASKKQRKKLLKRGATAGGCLPPSPPSPPPCTAAWANTTTFGSQGGGENRFSYPGGVAMSADELTAWIVDELNNRISVWTRQEASSQVWSNQTTFGSLGSGPNQLNRPRGVAVSPDGRTVWVADSSNHRVSVWTRPDSSSTSWSNLVTFGSLGAGPDAFTSPEGVAVAADARTAWIADTDNSRISVWTRPDTGSATWTNQVILGGFGSGANQFSSPEGVTVSDDGLTLVVGDTGNARIAVWTRANTSAAWANQATFGSFGGGASQINGPNGVALSADELTVWVADTSNHRISIWTRPATGSTSWSNQTTFGSSGSGSTGFNFPEGVAASVDGRTVWVADTDNSRISAWSLERCRG